MLEPLIVLTVLNCVFMFSSTVTTCALWWQYRSHRCCFKKDSMYTSSTKHASSKGKSHSASKKSGNYRQDSFMNSLENNRRHSSAAREGKCRKSCKQRPKTSTKLHSGSNFDNRTSSIEATELWRLTERARFSEASQTDAKSAVVMEYSTVQKIVQILDSNTDLAATKLAIRDLNAKANNNEKKELIIEQPLGHLVTPDYTAELMEHCNHNL